MGPFKREGGGRVRLAASALERAAVRGTTHNPYYVIRNLLIGKALLRCSTNDSAINSDLAHAYGRESVNAVTRISVRAAHTGQSGTRTSFAPEAAILIDNRLIS